MLIIPIILVATAAFATAVFAHSGVKNPAVKARMDLMGEIKEATGVLGNMAKGTLGFDAAQAAAAQAALLDAAERIDAAFEAPESDPKSEALPVIWTDWAGFQVETAGMIRAVAALDPGSLTGVRAGIGPIGQSCGRCHEGYRIKK